jgi:hypothetical protein
MIPWPPYAAAAFAPPDSCIDPSAHAGALLCPLVSHRAQRDQAAGATSVSMETSSILWWKKSPAPTPGMSPTPKAQQSQYCRDKKNTSSYHESWMLWERGPPFHLWPLDRWILVIVLFTAPYFMLPHIRESKILSLQDVPLCWKLN